MRGNQVVRKTIAVGFAATVLPALVLWGSTTSSSAASAAADSGSTTLPENFASGVAQSVDAFGQQEYPSVFGGVTMTDNGTHLVIYLTSLIPAVESSLQATALAQIQAAASQQGISANSVSSSNVSFTLSPTSEATQLALNTALGDDYEKIRNLGIDLAYTELNYVTREEQVGVINLTSAQSAYLTSTYGPDVDVVDVPSASAPVAFDRENDSSPWNGGDFITDKSSTCSSGIPTHTPNGGQYIVTAAHCFALGDEIYNGADFCNTQGCTTYGTLNPIGSVSERDGSHGGLDAELIFAADSPLVWTGYTVNAVRTQITGGYGSPAGEQVCADGAFEGTANCSFSVDAQGCTTLGNYYFCHLLHASGTNSQAVGQEDSGGPVITYFSSGAYLVGTISGGDGTMVQCVNWSPQAVPRECSPNLWYTDWEAEQAQWGLTINTTANP